MAGRLLVPDFGEWDKDSLYRDLIRNVAVPTGQYIRRQSAHSGSRYSHSSGASSSYYSSGSASRPSSTTATGIAEFCVHDELTKIARRMVNDGYAQRMINAFGSGGPDTDSAPLETWFLELDVDWVLQLHEEHWLPQQLKFKSVAWVKDLIGRWIRALTVIVVSMVELVLVVPVDEMLAVARFGKASMANMLVFVDAIVPALKEEKQFGFCYEGPTPFSMEKLQTLVDMYVYVSSASYMFPQLSIYSSARTILCDIKRSLSRKVISLREAISSIMEAVRTVVEDDDSWAILIPRGRGEVHQNTFLMMDCITSMVRAEVSMRNTMGSRDTKNLRHLIDDSVNYLKDLLLRKSKLCSDPSLRYLFLLNNFYAVAQLSEPRPGYVLTPECKKFMKSYLGVSWGPVLSHIRNVILKDSCLDVSCGHVLFCILKTCFHESRQQRKITSSLAKFESAFRQVYQAQKFWKVPDPQLKIALRNTIIESVMSDYCCYLKKHPELEKHVSSGGSSPDMLKEMLGDMFEG